MACRVLIGSEGVRVSKPGIDVYNWGSEQNLLINMGSRVGQILAHGAFPLSLADNTASGRTDIGPFTETPDIIWQILFSDGLTRFPAATWYSDGATFIALNDVKINVSSSGISASMSAYFLAGVPTPAWVIYQIMRKAQM